MAARIHPGNVRHLWDHHVATLRGPTDGRVAFVSLYEVVASPTLGRGAVAVVEIARPDRGALSGIIGSSHALAERMARRLHDLGMREPALDNVSEGRIERGPISDDGAVVWRIEVDGSVVGVEWRRPRTPFWLDAPAPALVATEDIWACFVEYDAATVTVDARAVAGAPFLDDVWVSKVGRGLSSAHIAFGEVRVDPPGAMA